VTRHNSNPEKFTIQIDMYNSIACTIGDLFASAGIQTPDREYQSVSGLPKYKWELKIFFLSSGNSSEKKSLLQ